MQSSITRLRQFEQQMIQDLSCLTSSTRSYQQPPSLMTLRAELSFIHFRTDLNSRYAKYAQLSPETILRAFMKLSSVLQWPKRWFLDSASISAEWTPLLNCTFTTKQVLVSRPTEYRSMPITGPLKKGFLSWGSSSRAGFLYRYFLARSIAYSNTQTKPFHIFLKNPISCCEQVLLILYTSPSME